MHALSHFLKKSHYLIALLICGAFLLSSCSGKKDEGPERSARELYLTAKEELDKGNYQSARNAYEELEGLYPFGKYADQGQLEIIYAYYQNKEYNLAIASADRFIRLHPTHPHVDYAHYMRGLSFYHSNFGLIIRFSGVARSKRDLNASREAFTAFQSLIERYPDSVYNANARQHMVEIRNSLAEQEVHVAEFYMKREAYLAAASRAQYVVENFQGAPVMPEALKIMAQAYDHMDLPDLAAQTREVLAQNFTA